MLRMMFGGRRKTISTSHAGESGPNDCKDEDIELEPWPDSISRITHDIEGRTGSSYIVDESGSFQVALPGAQIVNGPPSCCHGVLC